MSLFSDAIANLRERKGMSPQHVVHALAESGHNISASTFYRIESGESVPRDREFVGRLGKILDPDNVGWLVSLWEQAEKAKSISRVSHPAALGKTIGIISVDPTILHMSEVLKYMALQAKMRDLGLRYSQDDFPQGQRQCISEFCRRGVDGIIVAALRMDSTEFSSTLSQVESLGIPLVVLNRSLASLRMYLGGREALYPYLGVVRADPTQAYTEAFNYLVDVEKCGNIWSLNGSSLSETEQTRRKVIRSLANERSIKITEIETSSWDHMAGYQSVINLLPPTGKLGILTFSDEMALGVWKACLNKRLQVPRDVSIIGGYRSYAADYSPYSLTSIRFPAERIALRAIDMILYLASTPLAQITTVSEFQREAVYPCKLEVGDSTSK